MSYMALTNSGHTAIAESMYIREMWVSWGDIPAFISAPTGLSVTEIAGGSLSIGTYKYVVTTVTDFGETDGSAVLTHTLNSVDRKIKLTWNRPSMNSQPNPTYKIYGRTDGSIRYLGSSNTEEFIDIGTPITSVISVPIENRTSYTPWVQNPLPPDPSHHRLLREIGRRKILIKKYVYPDENGAIITLNNKWNESTVPTRHVYLYVGFDLNDASSSIIYQFGIFVDTVPIPECINYNYLNYNQVQNPGLLLSLEHTVPIYRNPATKEIHEIVMTF